MASGSRPVDQCEAFNTSKLANIVAHQSSSKGEAVASNQEIVSPNRRAQSLEDCGLLSVMAANGLPFGVEHGHLPGERIKLPEGCLAALAALGALDEFPPGDERRGCLYRAGRSQRFTLLNQQLILLLLSQSRHEVGVKAGQQIDQGLAQLIAAGMDEQIPFRRAADLHPVCGEPELRGDAHGLAVAVHEHPAGKAVHGANGRA